MKKPGTFSQIYIQFVFAVEGRRSLISESWENNLYKYISGLISNKGQKPLAINGAYDHIHILAGLKLSCCPSDLMREIKKSSNTWINDNGFTKSSIGKAGVPVSHTQDRKLPE